MICSRGYTNWVRDTDLITWISKYFWEILLSVFSHAERISACPRKIICNKCEQNNMRGEVLNAGDNIDDQEYFGLTESYFKIAPTNIDDYWKKLLSMQQENLRHQINIENNDKKLIKDTRKLYRWKKSDEKYQISKNDEEKTIEDIEIMKLQNLSSKKIYIYLEEKSDKINSNYMGANKESDERE